jgi:SAM-dependent methyltransferase
VRSKLSRVARRLLNGDPSAERTPRTADAVRGINNYGCTLTDHEMAQGRHRQLVGGQWEVIGALQFDYLVSQGLEPQHRLLDVGCGAMRGGIHFAAYLEPAHYFGIDVNGDLLEAARRVEIPAAGLAGRMPPENLRASERFEAPFDVAFDYALAVSLFTHLPLNHVRLCLYQIAQVMRPGGRFFATFFPVAEDSPYDVRQRHVVATTQAERDPFHYRPSEMEWAASVADWDFRYIGDWSHPRGQHMAEFRKK